MRIYTTKAGKKSRKKQKGFHATQVDANVQSVNAKNQKLIEDLEDLQLKFKEKTKRHERDLGNLRDGIDVLESGLRKRSTESVDCLRKVDESLQAVEGRMLKMITGAEGAEALVDLKDLIPEIRQDLADLKSKIDIDGRAAPAAAVPRVEVEESSPRQEGQTVLESPSGTTDKVLSEYQSALEDSQSEARNLLAKLNSCLGEKATMKREMEETLQTLELKGKSQAEELSSMQAREASALKRMQDLESRVKDLAATKDSSEKRMAVLKAQLADTEQQMLSFREQNARLREDNESLSAFGAKQKKEINALKQLVSTQKEDIREALAVMASLRTSFPAPESAVVEEEEEDGGDESEESSGELEEIEQEMAHLDFELNRLTKSVLGR
ncbi:hypothetical protein HOP50_02g11010 [Chloropicon primus]|uniref:Uncharacterized protein n=1 Tax=Chloropicon primus TaxID=1764295 RepID=A0A5B8MDX9_9CHLO|nr:hypothetical protein A3770_02p11150 [Chloropicon primus]UPQ97806.1 hypothetical protein HOP50_02g11010 [Chloropicon primus]|eukprot:QDZ18597.1 hypothetical protein A3770_02p11150 [Chloropicon primus]